MKLSSLRQDRTAVDGGAWVDKIPGFPSVAFRARGLSSKAYNDALSREQRNLPDDQRDANGQPNDDALDGMVVRAVAASILTDWKGIEDDNGKAIPFDADFAEWTIVDPEMREFFGAVLFAAREVDKMRKAPNVKAAAKNSPRRSGRRLPAK